MCHGCGALDLNQPVRPDKPIRRGAEVRHLWVRDEAAEVYEFAGTGLVLRAGVGLMLNAPLHVGGAVGAAGDTCHAFGYQLIHQIGAGLQVLACLCAGENVRDRRGCQTAQPVGEPLFRALEGVRIGHCAPPLSAFSAMILQSWW